MVGVVAVLRESGFKLLDAQYPNDHLAQFGCELIPRSTYLERLHDALEVTTSWPEAGPLPAWKP